MSNTDEAFKLRFTGKMSLLLELEDSDGPMEIAVNDKDIVLEVLATLLTYADKTMTVQTQTKAKSRSLRRILEAIP